MWLCANQKCRATRVTPWLHVRSDADIGFDSISTKLAMQMGDAEAGSADDPSRREFTIPNFARS